MSRSQILPGPPLILKFTDFPVYQELVACAPDERLAPLLRLTRTPLSEITREDIVALRFTAECQTQEQIDFNTCVMLLDCQFRALSRN